MDNTISFARKNGFTQTLFKRKRYLPDLKNKNKQIQKAAERIAINSPVQGSAADIIKVAMNSIQVSLNSKKVESKMVLQVHDELLFECPKNEIGVMVKLTQTGMEKACSLKVPLKVDIGWGENWNEAH